MFAAECGGKMHLREGEYEKAHTDFFEAFKNYDESGSPRSVSQFRHHKHRRHTPPWPRLVL